MSLRWLVFRYLPPGAVVSPHRRQVILARALRGPDGARVAVIPIVMMSGLVVVAVALAAPRWWLILAMPLVLWLTAALAGLWTVAPAVRRELQKIANEMCLACGYTLKGLRDDTTACPECGAALRVSSCVACGHSLRGLEAPRYCPECGEDQGWTRPPPNLRWLVCQYVDRRVPLSRAELAAARRRGLRRVSGWRHLAVIGGTVASVFGLLFFLIWAVMRPEMIQEYEPLMRLSTGVWAGFFTATWWITLTLLARWVYAPAVRAAVRDAGYDVCLRCGHWVRDTETGWRRCVGCGARRDAPEAGGS